MGNKIGSDWKIESISPEGEINLMAWSGNVYVAAAAYREALKHRPGRVVRFVHGALILRQRVGWQCEYWKDAPETCDCPMCQANQSEED